WLPLWILVTQNDRVRARLAEPDLDAEPHAPDAEAKTPESRWHLLRSRAVQRAVGLVILSSPGVMFVLIWFPQFLEKAFSVKENDIGHYAWVPPLFFDAGAVLFGALASRRERNLKSTSKEAVLSHVDLMVVAGTLASSIILLPNAASPWMAVFIASASLAGGGALFARLTADMIARVDAAHVSTAGGITAAAQSLAYVIANPLVGHSVDATGGYSRAAFTIGCLALPGALVWVLWSPKNGSVKAAG
ncbi:MAG: hypothetical protein ABI461_09270, partial [Polyangiaceae bacterium]